MKENLIWLGRWKSRCWIYFKLACETQNLDTRLDKATTSYCSSGRSWGSYCYLLRVTKEVGKIITALV